MAALRDHGYHAVTLAQVERYWRRGYALPGQPVVLSFDDGYLGDYTRARPVLQALGWPGVLNLEVNNVRPGDLEASQVRALIAAGWEVDSHTVTHPNLTTLDAARLRTELVDSRAYLRRTFGVPVDYFCYPSGHFDARVEAAVRSAGYRLATTTQPGLASPARPLALDRIRIDGQDGAAGLLAKLRDPSRRRAPTALVERPAELPVDAQLAAGGVVVRVARGQIDATAGHDRAVPVPRRRREVPDSARRSSGRYTFRPPSGS